MPRISTDNYDTVASWNGSQDLFVVEQTDGTKVATPAMVKQYVLGDMDEVPTQNSNNPVKSGGIYSKIGDLTQTGLTGDSVAAQLTAAGEQIDNLIKFKDVTVNPNTSGYAAPSSTAGGVWIESLASYEALGVSREKIIGIIPVDWSSISQPLSFYLGSTSLRVMLHSSSSIYSSPGWSYVKIRVVYHS